MTHTSGATILKEGILAAQAGDKASAQTQLMQAAELLPDNPHVWLWLAWTADKPAVAATLLQRLLENCPGHPTGAAALQWVEAMTKFDPERVVHPPAQNTLPPMAEPMDEHSPCTPNLSEEHSPEEYSPEDNHAIDATVVLEPAVVEQEQSPASLANPVNQPRKQDLFQTPTNSGSDRRTIVVADDSPTVRKLVSLTLESRDFRVETADDGYSALQKIAVCQPVLVLTDINMPRIDGYQLCRMLKRHPATRGIAVVMLTANDGMFDKIRGKMVGCNDYLTKPFEPSELIRTVESHLSVGV